jgi:hypothetical protein
MAERNWFYGKVVDNQDPLNLGRCRIEVITDRILAIQIGAGNGFNELLDKWQENDPFVFNSLLPIFVYAVPQVNELVQVYYHNSDAPFLNRYYVQAPFSRVQNIGQEDYNQEQKYTDINGLQISGATAIRNLDGTYKESRSQGVFPEPGDKAILGRGTSDLIVKEDEVLLRAGRFRGQLRNNVSPLANPNRAFLQLSKLQQKVDFGALQRQGQVKVKNVQVKFLIEYDITNPETQLSPPQFNGSVRLFRLLPSTTTTSDNLKVDTNIENSKLIVAQENFSNLDSLATISFINNFLQTCNSKLKTKTGVVLFNVLEDRFPIFFRPTPNNYKLMTTSTDSFTKSNLTEIYQKIKLNTNDKRGGWGLIISESKTGQPIQIVLQSFRQRINSALPETYGLLGANYLYLLSQFSSIPGKEKINFDNSLYGFNEEQIGLNITPNTSSMVRGEELLELLNFIVRFMISHTHGFPGEAPVPITEDGITVSQVLTTLNEANQKVLNQYIRLN